ncbi:MAG: hypothetical protein HQ556_02885 [Candidatus Marinimicrobia bacterium]|nr:hypothetical protein [Candidatus Neomarinimicrobiota bacterium]
MKRLIFILIILMESSLFSQFLDTLETSNYTGEKAVLFEFNNLRLDTFQGGIGFKYWISKRKAYTGNIKLSVIKDEKDKSEQLMGEESSEIFIGVNFGIEKHIAFINRISPYYGLTLGSGFEKINNKVTRGESTYFLWYPSYYNNDVETSLLSFTFQFNLGVEYFIHNYISLEGQYSLGGFYKYGEEKIVSNIVEDSRHITELNVGISSSSLILSIYF